jgi:NAD(P)-dependent dehydrogenase (short-subunit alcohol dehydrogenase family)
MPPRSQTAPKPAKIFSSLLGAAVGYRPLDLADLASARRCAAQALSDYDGIDILVNNAGVTGGPNRRTADGFEMHLRHFALTGLLLRRCSRERAGGW